MQLFSTPSAYLDPADEVTHNATTSSYQSKMLSARRAISGTFPEPLLSRRPYGLNQITVELYRVSQLDLTEQLSEHAVSVLLRGSVNLLQRRNGKASRRMMH